MALIHGLHMVLGYNGSKTFRDNALDAIKSVNCQIAREAIPWYVAEASEGVYDWSRFDDLLAEYAERGIDVIVNIINESPAWANGDANELTVPDGSELVVNGGFETAGGGGADVFASWTESAGDGTIVQGTGSPKIGSYKADLTAGPSANTYIHQTVAVSPETAYRLRICNAWSTANGRYLIYDVSNSAEIISLTLAGQNWGPTYAYFTTPEGCESVRIELHCPATNGQTARFDGISLRQYFTSSFTTWVGEFAGFVGDMVARYKSQVNKWTIGNEPEDEFFWLPFPCIKQFTYWYEALRGAIKSEDPLATVGASGSTNLGGAGNIQMWPGGGVGFIEDFYTEAAVQGATKPDVVTAHPYCGDPSVHTDYENNWDDIEDLRAAMVAAGEEDKKIWLTEFGWAAGSAEEQATAAGYLKWAINSMIEEYSYVELYTYFMGYDTGGYTEGLFAVSGSIFTPKPLLTSVFSYRGHEPGTCWGEQHPVNEQPVSWDTWVISGIGASLVSGDADWGKLRCRTGEQNLSSVADFGDAKTKRFVVRRDKYGSGSGGVTLYIRGSGTSFDQTDESPEWTEYVAPVKQAWRYVQVRVDYT